MEIVEPIKKKEDIEQFANYLFKTSFKFYVIFILGINTGLRVSDILNLKVEDVKNKDRVFIREQKTGKNKQFPLNKKLQKLLKDYLKTIDNESNMPIFIGERGDKLHRSIVYRALNEAKDKCKMKISIGTHTMRKTFGYHFYKKYNDVVLLQKILNHSSPDITLRYIGITQDEIDNAYMNFEL